MFDDMVFNDKDFFRSDFGSYNRIMFTLLKFQKAMFDAKGKDYTQVNFNRAESWLVERLLCIVQVYMGHKDLMGKDTAEEDARDKLSYLLQILDNMEVQFKEGNGLEIFGYEEKKE
jgi:hypothetical protein